MCRQQHSVRGALRAYHVQEWPAWGWAERPCSWPAGGGSLWPCHVGFAVGIGEPQKGFEQGKDMTKCGFNG